MADGLAAGVAATDLDATEPPLLPDFEEEPDLDEEPDFEDEPTWRCSTCCRSRCYPHCWCPAYRWRPSRWSLLRTEEVLPELLVLVTLWRKRWRTSSRCGRSPRAAALEDTPL